jgi:phosphoglycerate dehydrogenase-like enzyme
MKVLFLGQAGNLDPWLGDLVSAIGEAHCVEMYDPHAPLAQQFSDVGVVVDQGGGQGTHAMVDTAAETGVKLWQVLGTGLDHVDITYIVNRGLPLANTPGPFSSVALAEHALLFMLYFAKQFPLSQRNLRSGVFYRPLNAELEGSTLGLIGLGASGRELAKRAAAFGMRIVGLDVQPPPQEVLDSLGVACLGGPEALEGLLGQSEYVSIHVPLTGQTRHMLDARALASMRRDAVLINVARGEIVDQAALLDTLRNRRIRGAGIDVFAHEPLDPDDPLLELDNIVLTPHVAGGTTGTSRRRAEAVAENVRRTAAGLSPLYTVTRAE